MDSTIQMYKVKEKLCTEQDHLKKHITRGTYNHACVKCVKSATVNFIDDDDAPFFSNFLRSYFMCYVECT